MDKSSNNNIKRQLIVVITLLGLIVSHAGVATSSNSSRTQPACIGKVEISHAIGDTTGLAIVNLPAVCQHGVVLLSASSLIDGEPIIPNYNLHQGDLVIRTTFLSPLTAPVITEVSYNVIP